LGTNFQWLVGALVGCAAVQRQFSYFRRQKSLYDLYVRRRGSTSPREAVLSSGPPEGPQASAVRTNT
jgi:hypothetical protein